MSSKEEVAAKILKVYNLAQRAEGGEREAAAHHLSLLLDKYGWTLEDLEKLAPKTRYHEFSYKGKEEKELLIHVVTKVVWDSRGERMETYYNMSRTRASFDLTDDEAKEARRLFDAYRAPLKRELDRVLGVFFYKHNLIVRDDNGDDEDRKPVDPEEVERLISLLRGMRDVDIPLPESRRLQGG